MKIVVLKNGKIVSSELYDWNENTKTFSTNSSGLVLDFGELTGVTIKCGNFCTINSSDSCTINSGDFCTINSRNSCTINSGYSCTINSGYSCTINSGFICTINSGSVCTIKCGDYCTIRTYWNTEIVAGKNCILNYIYDGICECYKLPEQKKCKILKSGKLEQIQEKTETELQIDSLKKTIEEANAKVIELQKQIQKK